MAEDAGYGLKRKNTYTCTNKFIQPLLYLTAKVNKNAPNSNKKY